MSRKNKERKQKPPKREREWRIKEGKFTRMLSDRLEANFGTTLNEFAQAFEEAERMYGKLQTTEQMLEVIKKENERLKQQRLTENNSDNDYGCAY